MGRRRRKKSAEPKEVRPPLAKRVIARIEEWGDEAAACYDLLLYDVTVTKQWVIRVYVDKADAEPGKGVEIAQCAKVSRYMEGLLDADEDVWDKYTIEVSSPGIERKLSKPKHYELSIGKTIALQVDPPIEGNQKIKGALTRFEQEVAHITVDETELEIPFNTISKAHVVYEFN